MIVDTSAIIAILKDESDYSKYSEAMLLSHKQVQMSAASYLEAGIVFDAANDGDDDALDALIKDIRINITAVTAAQARTARQAYRQYGKGSGHPTQLNFGDCFAYALAKDSGEALLFKGTDFSQTDIVAVLP
jgi:ribonuclease VapC